MTFVGREMSGYLHSECVFPCAETKQGDKNDCNEYREEVKKMGTKTSHVKPFSDVCGYRNEWQMSGYLHSECIFPCA